MLFPEPVIVLLINRQLILFLLLRKQTWMSCISRCFLELLYWDWVIGNFGLVCLYVSWSNHILCWFSQNWETCLHLCPEVFHLHLAFCLHMRFSLRLLTAVSVHLKAFAVSFWGCCIPWLSVCPVGWLIEGKLIVCSCWAFWQGSLCHTLVTSYKRRGLRTLQNYLSVFSLSGREATDDRLFHAVVLMKQL